jgi:hypothetical protein
MVCGNTSEVSTKWNRQGFVKSVESFSEKSEISENTRN